MSATHLVLYARIPRKGAVKTRMEALLDPEERLVLHLSLLEDSVRLLRLVADRAGARPVLAFSETWDPSGDPAALGSLAQASRGMERLPQRGDDLGARLRNTFADLGRSGAGGAVIFGSDSPTLPPEWLESACEKVARGSGVVLGPALDGGYYLIGARTPPPGLFEGLSWGSGAVLESTLRGLLRLGRRPSLLPPWYDVDRPEDLRRVRRDAARWRGFGPDRTESFVLALEEGGRLP